MSGANNDSLGFFGAAEEPQGTWDLATASYTGKYKAIVAPSGFTLTYVTGLAISPDGMHLYISDQEGLIFEYAMSTPWDVSTVTAVRGKSVATNAPGSYGVQFSPDGTKMFVMSKGNKTIVQYNLSTAWNISTATYVGQFSSSGQGTFCRGLYVNAAGTRAYRGDYNNDYQWQYNMSTGWDISTMSYATGILISSYVTVCGNIALSADGTKMFVTASENNDVEQFNLSTPWQISTAVWAKTFAPSQIASGIHGIAFNPTGKIMVLAANYASKYLWQYNVT